MTHIVTEACISCKYTSCVEVCPVACFFEGPNMLVIDPDICIDCGICVGECPAGAIVTDDTEEGQKWLGLNRQFSKIWPNIQFQKEPLPKADEYKDEPDKYNRFFESGK